MRILILEDSRRRIKKIRKQFLMHRLTFFEDACEAIDHIRSNSLDYDAFFLDHDLGNKIFCSRRNRNTGLFFVKSVLEEIKSSRTLALIVIHSWNPIGAMRMKKVLKDCGKTVRWVPYRYPF